MDYKSIILKKKLTVLLFFFSAMVIGQESDMVLDSLKNVLIKTKNDSVKADAYAKTGWRLLVLGRDITLVKSNLDSAKILFEKRKDSSGLVSLDYRYGVMYRFQGDFIKATECFNKIMPVYIAQKDSSKIANTLYQKGVISEMIGDYEKSLLEFFKILKIYKAQNNQRGIGLTLNSLGVVYTKLNKFSEAIKSFKEAIIIHESRNELVDVANANSNLADVYLLEKKLNKAEEHYRIARKINLETKNKWGHSINNQKISEILILNKNYSEAIPYLNEALEIQEKNEYKSEMAFTLCMLGKVYRNLGNFNRSEKYLSRGLANMTSAKKPMADLNQEMYLLYKGNRKFEIANTHLVLYQVYKDSLLNEESLNSSNLLQIRFETEKKDNAILAQSLKLEQNETELQKKKTQYSYMTGTALVLLVGSTLLWFLYQQRQKRKNQEILTLKREYQVKTLESLIEGEQKERFRIAKELHDGVNGDLSAIKYKLSSLIETNNKVVNEAIKMIDASCKQVRAISHDLVPPSLESFNLVEATELYCNNLNLAHKEVSIKFQHLGEMFVITKKAEINTYRIIQELITNSLKHAEATLINVQISYRDYTMQITIEDDGKGFNKDEIVSNGIGLNNVQSRIDYLNAKIDCISNKNGTSYAIDIDKEQQS